MKKLLLLALISIITISAYTQSTKILVCDETEYVASGKSSFRIVTSNDSVSSKLIKTFANHGKVSKLTYTTKKDRFGKYWERSFYFRNEYYDEVFKLINEFNKKK